MNYKIILLCNLLNTYVNCANILGIFTIPSYSHQIVYQTVWKELAFRGHNVTVITPDPVRDPTIPNLQEIDISFGYEVFRNRNVAKNIKVIPSAKEVLTEDFKIFGDITEKIFLLPEVKEILNSSVGFDLVIAEWIYPGALGFSAKFKCPIVGLSSLDISDTLNEDMGNPTYPTLYPNFFLPFTNELTIWQRLVSWEFSMWLRHFFYSAVYPRIDRLNKIYLGDVPPVKDIIKNVSMVFVNTNPIFSKPKPNIPTIVEISGLHIKPVKPLQEDIKEFLDEAQEGAIYVSFGTNVRSNMLPEHLKRIFAEALSELPYRVLWKFEETNMTTLSDNVKIINWGSQQDILAHKNTKAFVTQGGLQSLEETIRNKVPIVGIPFLYDQPRNIRKMVNLGSGKDLDIETITKESLKRTIIEVAENKKYRRNTAKMADFLNDISAKSMDQVIWWIEFIILHKRATYLKSPFIDIPSYKYFHLDILCFVMFFVICIIAVTLYILKLLLNIMKRFRKSKTE